jgi:transmembrane sensor
MIGGFCAKIRLISDAFLMVQFVMSSSPPKSPSDLHEAASRWVALVHSGSLTPAQRQAFDQWLNESENHRRAYREVDAFWQSLAPLQQVAAPELAAARAYLRQAQRRRSVLRPGLALAASILLLAAAVPIFRVWLDNGVYQTAKGEQAHIELSDGSRIDLNTDSTLRVAYGISERTVILERGEALFTVSHDENHPFAVYAAKGRIRDLGTQFNVYRHGDQVTVTVLEGEVGVDSEQSSAMQNLQPGMQLTYRHDGSIGLPRRVETDAATAWREGRLVFKRQALDEVLAQLSRYHAVDLRLDDASLKRLQVSGSFPTGDLDLVLNTIAAGLPVKVARHGTGQVVLEPLSRHTKRPK